MAELMFFIQIVTPNNHLKSVTKIEQQKNPNGTKYFVVVVFRHAVLGKNIFLCKI